MSCSIIPLERGKIEIKDSIVKCYLGKQDNYISSEEAWKTIKDEDVKTIENQYEFGGVNYIISFPVISKNISIVKKDGKRLKATIYFNDDIKNLISGLELNNPCFLQEGEYVPFESEQSYGKFLYGKNLNEIKDIGNENINFEDLKNQFKNFTLKQTKILEDINKNIKFYSKIDNIEKQEYFITSQRTYLFYEFNGFIDNEKRDKIEDVIYGMYGNYASGKSFFLINYNYSSKYPSIYLNLKALKNAFETEGFSNLLNNEIIILFKKLHKSFEDFKTLISKFLPYQHKKLDDLLLSLIEEIKQEKAIIIIDQYKDEVFDNINFIIQLKRILTEKRSKIKVIISSSINNGPIRTSYLNSIFKNNLFQDNKNGDNEIIENNEDKEINEIIENKESKDNNGTIENKESKDNDEIIENNEDKEINEIIENKESKDNDGTIENKESKDNDGIIENNEDKENNEDIENKESKENKDKQIKNAHILDNFIPYHFMQKLVEDYEIKSIMIKQDLANDIEFDNTLKLFNYLPLYYILCKIHKNNLPNFINQTKQRIETKFKQFYNDSINLTYLDDIRRNIDNEIDLRELKKYGKYIPFKFFYIEKIDNKYFLKPHFPLIKEIFEDLIMKQTTSLFDGEIKYPGNVIGSFLELNIINNIKDNKINLDIDSFIKVDTITNFDALVEQDTKEFKNKNIFITQKNENAPNFDIAYLIGKNVQETKLVYIQVKKSYSTNRVDIKKMREIFDEKKKNISNILGFIPKDTNLIYISLINEKLKNAIIKHSSYKKAANKKVSELEKNLTSLVYSINQLNNFCVEFGIPLFYYNPKENLFYKKKLDNFISTGLDLNAKNDDVIYRFSYSFILEQIEKSKDDSKKINEKYKEFLKKKRKPTDKFSYDTGNFDIGIVLDFAKDYFNKILILNYIDLHKTHLDCIYENLTKNKAIIIIKIDNKKDLTINSFIYKDKLIKVNNNQLEFVKGKGLERDNDYLITIYFESISESLKKFLKC